MRPSYLDVALIDTPTLALERARLEIGHMGDFVNRMLLESIPALLSGKLEQIREISAIDDKVDILYAEIVAYLGKVGKKELTDSQAKQLSKLLAAVNDLENIGDLIETNALDLAEQCADQHLHMSDVTKKVLTDLHTSVAGSVEVALRAVIMNDAVAARVVIGMKRQIQEQVTSAELHEARRLVANAPNRVAVYSVEVELIEKLKRVYYFAKRMAKTIDQGNSTDASVKDVG